MDEAFAWADEPAAAELAPALLPDGSFAVWPENWQTLQLFWAVRRCWRMRPMGGLMGFDWSQVQSKLQLLGLNRRRMKREAGRLELMEDAVLTAVNKAAR